ncbi:hypothetical protein LIP_0134 [Limnochorda pilosa]|uniref:Uncharacterized protein n=1 Tax=Limnochorda pilosa TaxID=1555112 RepID=A0A0K2SFW0_LIMPI|nr:hypothetical protein LIP_0134 [Limnochorda pilosa]
MQEGPDEERLAPLLARMRRIEGQARGIQRMLQEGRPCHEVVMQLAAMRAALSKVGMALIADNLERCVSQGDDPRATLDQARDLLMKFS